MVILTDDQLTMSGDEWVNADELREWTVKASVHEAEVRLSGLDERVHTILTLASPSGGHLTVGGGNGRFVVYVGVSDLEIWNLLRPNNNDVSKLLLTAGGQEGHFSTRQVVDLATARAACLWYLEHRTRNPSLRWEKQA